MKEEKRNQVFYFSNNSCVSCGKTIPEGQMVCQHCLNKDNQEENIIKNITTESTLEKLLCKFNSLAPDDELYHHIINKLIEFNAESEKIVEQFNFKRYSNIFGTLGYSLLILLIIIHIIILLILMSPIGQKFALNNDLTNQLLFILIILLFINAILLVIYCVLENLEDRKEINLIQMISNLNNLSYGEIAYINRILEDNYIIINKYKNKDKVIYEVEYQYIGVNECPNYKDCINGNFINICTKKRFKNQLRGKNERI